MNSSRNGVVEKDQSILTTSTYLEVTYDPSRIPYGEYPYLLGRYLLERIYMKPGRLLELGCGRGEHMAVFSRLGFSVSGIDISPSSPQLAKGYQVKVADLEHDELPYESNSFDYVFSKSVIEHMRHPSCLMMKAWQALRPGGIAVLMTPSWAHTYWGPFYIDHTHVTPFTRPSLADALSIVGFENVRVSYFYQLPFIWKYPFLKILVLIIAALPFSYRPYQAAPWPEGFNKLIRFSKEVMLLGIARKPER